MSNSAWKRGWGYVYGAIGQTCTESLLDQCAARYLDNNLAGGAMRKAGEKWPGRKVADCSGIVKTRYHLMIEEYQREIGKEITHEN